MKKKLEAELISIAHRILKLKNKSDIAQLVAETTKLYEKLVVLQFVEQHFAEVKPTIGQAEVSDKLTVVFDQPEQDTTSDTVGVSSPKKSKPVPESAAAPEAAMAAEEANVTEPETEMSGLPLAETADVAEDEEAKEAIETEAQPTANEAPVSGTVAEEEVLPDSDDSADDEEEALIDLEASAADEEEVMLNLEASAADEEHETVEIDANQSEQPRAEQPIAAQHAFEPAFELTFEKKEDLIAEPGNDRRQITFDDLLGPDYSDPVFEKVSDVTTKTDTDTAAINPVQSISLDEKDAYTKPPENQFRIIKFGLNDQIGFEKHLFGGSSEDMNRVLSQLATFDTFEEAREFIEDMVKPDYNNWEGKDDYAARFMETVEKKFS